MKALPFFVALFLCTTSVLTAHAQGDPNSPVNGSTISFRTIHARIVEGNIYTFQVQATGCTAIDKGKFYFNDTALDPNAVVPNVGNRRTRTDARSKTTVIVEQCIVAVTVTVPYGFEGAGLFGSNAEVSYMPDNADQKVVAQIKVVSASKARIKIQ